MSSKIQSYINSSSPGKNRLPVPKKSFKSVLGHDRNIIIKPQEDILDKANILVTELKYSKQPESKNNASFDNNTNLALVTPLPVPTNNCSNNDDSMATGLASHTGSSTRASSNSIDSASSASQHSVDVNRNPTSKLVLQPSRADSNNINPTDQQHNLSTKHNVEYIDAENYEDRRNDGRNKLNGADERESRREAREAFLKSDLIGKRFEPKIDAPDTHIAEKDHHLYNNTSLKTDNYINGTVQNGFNKTTKTPKEQDTYIGFANLPNQVYRKSVKKGFDFTLMLIGESGLGKSTLINSLFLTDIYNHQHLGPSLRPSKTVKVEKMCVLLKEGGVQLRLTVVDTPGFGDSVDNSNCWKPILKYIDDQFDSHLNMESKVVRHEVPDTRVHCCLYFISPNGHGLRQLDIECMKQLHEKVNIVPIIAKADTMTLEECRDFKKTILNEIEQHKIKIYEFPECEDEEEQKIMKKMKDKIPFAVVGSNVVVESGGRRVRGRVYPWGTVEVENLEHNDFTALRNMLVRTHLHDLKDVTNNVHYENFRYDRLLTSIGADQHQEHSNKSPMLQLQEEKEEHREKLQRMAQEMNQMFEAKVNERKHKHNESDLELQRRKEQLQKSLQQQEQDYEEMLRVFVAEREAWEEQNKHLEAEVNSTLKKKRNLFN